MIRRAFIAQFRVDTTENGQSATAVGLTPYLSLPGSMNGNGVRPELGQVDPHRLRAFCENPRASMVDGLRGLRGEIKSIADRN